MRVRVVVAAMVAACALPSPALAQGPLGPLNDLLALGQGEGQTPAAAPLQHNAEPDLLATPRAQCGPGSVPEPGIQGRVPAGAATNGLRCNVTLLSHEGETGGFRVWRYVDPKGHECAFYDTALLFPLNALHPGGMSGGVAVVDMSDPAHPMRTDTLTEPAMLSPHESLNVNAKRGLIAAVAGNPAFYPGYVSIYDASADCRHPVLQFSGLIARFGHESGFSQDGKTFYAAGTGTNTITAIDVTDPKAAHPIWLGNIGSHGMSLSDDGNRAYLADATGARLTILDTSEIQARKANPQAREVSRLAWKSISIPQNAIPFQRDGKPYLLEVDEYTAGTTGDGDGDDVGAARIIDISDERKPFVVSNLRLQVNQRDDHAAAADDPGAQSPVQGYAGHYCNVPTRDDPTIVACSFIVSGLRVFDISDLAKPREIAYYVAPTTAAIENGFQASNFAMSQPQIIPARKEIWYSDGPTGFYVLRVADSVWPKAAAASSGVCKSRRRFRVNLVVPRGAHVVSATAKLGTKKLRVTRRGRRVSTLLSLYGLPRRTVKVTLRARLRGGRVIATTRTYHPCQKRRA